MKESGIEWLGRIPADWKYARLKDYFVFEKGKKAALYTQEYIGNHLGSYPVYSGQTDNEGVMGLVDEYEYDIDECLFTTTVGAKVMTPRILHGKFCLSQNCLIMKNKSNIINNTYIYYVLLPLFDYSKSLIPNYMQPSLRVSDLNKYSFFHPNLQEQHRIADFLDRKCAEIDRVLEKTRASIEEYKKLKRSVITQAVTKGIRGEREMKDSGIKWVAEIPINWTVERGKNILNILNRPIEDNDGVVTCFRNGEVTLRSNRREEGYTFALQECGYQGVEKGDLVVHGMDGFAGAIGISDARGKASPVLNVMDSTQNKRYLMYELRVIALIGVFLSLSTGIRVRSCDTNWNKIKNLCFFLPPLEEQHRIANFLDRKCAEIDTLISKKEQLITELEAYKKSLIYEYVTGKKEVQ